MEYIPKEPYIFSSGKFPGKSIGTVFFKGHCQYLLTILKHKTKKTCQNKDELHLYLEWFFEQLKKVKAKSYCPHCHTRKIRYIALTCIPGDQSLDFSRTCCSNPTCKEKTFHKNDSPFEINFENISLLKNGARKNFIIFLRKEFDLPQRLSQKNIFNWVKKIEKNEKISLPIKLIGEEYLIDFEKT
jgi:hypothetical protein